MRNCCALLNGSSMSTLCLLYIRKCDDTTPAPVPNKQIIGWDYKWETFPLFCSAIFKKLIIITVIYCLFISGVIQSIPNSLGFKIYRNNNFSRCMLEHIDNDCYYASVHMRGLQKRHVDTSSLLDISFFYL